MAATPAAVRTDGATVFVSADDGTFAHIKTDEEKAKLIAYRLQFELDQYYKYIEPHTFRTVFVSFSIDECRAWREWNRGGAAAAAMSSEQKQAFEAMRKRLGDSITAFQDDSIRRAGKQPSDVSRADRPRVFVRLSTRSNKDCVDKLDPKTVLIPALRKHIARLRAINKTPPPPAPSAAAGVGVPTPAPAAAAASDSGDVKSAAVTATTDAKTSAAADSELAQLNLLFLALRYTFFDVLAASDVDRVLEMMSLSSRIVSDISRALTATTFIFGDETPETDEKGAVTAPPAPSPAPSATSNNSSASAAAPPPSPPHWNLKFIVREFVQLPIEGEFRGFVSRQQLTCLSQYYCDVNFPGLFGPRAQQIGERVLKFFNDEIKSTVPIDSYIIDFSVTDTEIKIVELNPFTPQTGGCLYDWKRDAELIANGPFSVRVVQHPNKNLSAALLPWNHLITAATAPPENENSGAGSGSGGSGGGSGSAGGAQQSNDCCVIS